MESDGTISLLDVNRGQVSIAATLDATQTATTGENTYDGNAGTEYAETITYSQLPSSGMTSVTSGLEYNTWDISSADPPDYQPNVNDVWGVLGVVFLAPPASLLGYAQLHMDEEE